MEGTPKDTRPRAGEFAATGGLPVRRCAFAKTKFFLRKLVFALPANPQVDVACGSACCVARSPQGGGGMRRARGSAYPSGVALEDFSKTVGRFACRGFRPPSLATDWEWGGFKTHPTSEASDRPSVSLHRLGPDRMLHDCLHPIRRATKPLAGEGAQMHTAPGEFGGFKVGGPWRSFDVL